MVGGQCIALVGWMLGFYVNKRAPRFEKRVIGVDRGIADPRTKKLLM